MLRGTPMQIPVLLLQQILHQGLAANEVTTSTISKRYLARGAAQVGRRQHQHQQSSEELLQELSRRSSVPLEEAAAGDYLGIGEDLGETAATIVHGEYCYEAAGRKQSAAAVRAKYEPLLEPAKSDSKGKLRRTWFGQVRLDSQNVPRFHGQYERVERPNETSNENKLARVMQHLVEHEVKLKKAEDGSRSDWKKESTPTKLLPPESDDQFEVIEVSSKTENSTVKSMTSAKIGFLYAADFAAELKARQRRWRSATEASSRGSEQSDWIEYERAKRERQPVKGAPATEESVEELSDPAVWSERMAQVKIEDFQAEDPKDSLFPEMESLNARDYLRKIYAGKMAAHFQAEVNEAAASKQLVPKRGEVLDSKGYRILSHQVPDFRAMTNAEILELLAKQVLFNDAEIVALNKPYGMAVHGGGGSADKTSSSSSSSSPSAHSNSKNDLHLNRFLPELAARLGVSKLYTVHRLDRDTTGLLLLATTQEKAHQLSRLFASGRVDKRYLAITKSVPHLREGLIDIPIEVGHAKVGPQSSKATRRERMVLCPEPVEEIRAQKHGRSKTAKQAVTHYRVVDEAGNAALLEVHPRTGVRHQIRVHLGFALRCPVLGDHKYSSLGEGMAPQRLPADILGRLRVRQAKARTVPMHLHAYMAVLGGMGRHGTDIRLRAPLPYHFTRNMASLRLRLKQ